MRDPQEAAAARALELLGDVEAPNPELDEATQEEGQVDEALARVSSSPEPAAQDEHEAEVVEEEPAFEVPNLDPKLPEDLAEELEMDWEDDEPEAVSDDEEEEEYENDDPRVEEVRAQNRKLQKRLEWAEKQRVEAKRERWAEEAKKYFPLSESALPNIQATSHRGFLREAKTAHESLKPFVSDIIAKYQASIEGAREQAMKEAEEKAAKAWGKPTVSSSGRETTTETARRERLSGSRDLTERIKARLYPED